MSSRKFQPAETVYMMAGNKIVRAIVTSVLETATIRFTETGATTPSAVAEDFKYTYKVMSDQSFTVPAVVVPDMTGNTYNEIMPKLNEYLAESELFATKEDLIKFISRSL